MMRRRTFLAICSAALSGGPLTMSALSAASSTLDDLWDRTVSGALKMQLWLPQQSYNAGHALMAPLHAAFAGMRIDRIQEFASQFHRFVREDRQDLGSCPAGEELSRLHYIYLATQFCRLAQDAGRSMLVDDALPDRLWQELADYFTKKPAWWFQPKLFQGGTRERIIWKLENTTFSLSHYGAIFDHELFALSAMADLRTSKAVRDTARRKLCEEALTLLAKSFASVDGSRRRAGFFSPEFWSSHPEFAHSGNTEVLPELPRNVRPNVAEDSAHSHRWPLYLRSFISNVEGADAALGRDVLQALEQQFFDVVVVWPTEDFPAPRLTNYMDGWNGVYRYGYATLGRGVGYGPYQLSGIITIGWWGFLPGDRSIRLWTDFAGKFPLAENVIALYAGPKISRQQGLMSFPSFFVNGFAELNARLFAAGDLQRLN